VASDSGFDAGGFPGLLGDMLKMMRTDAPLQWDLALQFSQTVASDGKPEPNVEPVQRMRFEELARIAEMQVADVTGMPTTPTGAPVRFATTGAAGWARRSLESWRPVIERFASAIRPVTPAAAERSDEEEDEEEKGLARLMEEWSKAIAPAMIALQVGSAIGHLARTTLGQYELPLPRREGDEIAVVPENAVRFADEWSLNPDDAVLWVAARDLAMHTVLSRPHVRERFSQLLVEHAETLRPDLQALVDRLGQISPSAIEDPNELGDLLGEAGFGADVDAPAARRVRAELATLSAVLVGYAQWATDAVVARVIGARRPVAEAMRRRLVEMTDEERAAEHLFGLDLSSETVDRGEAFVFGVLERGGEVELAKLWVAAENLPTPAELDAPGLWIARVNL
jgi:putative hydrolase